MQQSTPSLYHRDRWQCRREETLLFNRTTLLLLSSPLLSFS